MVIIVKKITILNCKFKEEYLKIIESEIESLYIVNSNLKDLRNIKQFNSLRKITLNNTKTRNIKVLNKMSNLEVVNFINIPAEVTENDLKNPFLREVVIKNVEMEKEFVNREKNYDLIIQK